jgi:CheY-like chemotaxis protein
MVLPIILCMENFKKKLLLVAEDDPLSQKIVQFSAQSLGLKVLVVDSVKALIKSFDSKPDAVLVDLHLPDMDIEELLLTLKEVSKGLLRLTKIVLMTAGLTDEIKELCKKYGFDSLIEKPITDEILMSVFDAPTSSAVEKSVPSDTKTIDYQDKDSIIDLSFYIKGIGDNPNLLQASLTKVEKSWESYLEKMEKAIVSNDPKQLHYWAHTLKGSLGFIKATDGVELAKKVCEKAKAGKVEGTEEPVKKLKDYIKKVYTEVDKVKDKIKEPTS